MSRRELLEIIADWRLPEGDSLLDRVEKMICPALIAGHFGASYTSFLAGMQYHLGGETDTAELADLARIKSSDRILDACCFIGGPAIQLLETFSCTVTGIDIAENYILAANRIMQLTKLTQQSDFCVADAENLPFKEEVFTVVWNQASLPHKESWLREFDRVLVPRGRFAFTFRFRGKNATEQGPFSKWTIQDVVAILRNLGYTVEHVEDITGRDIEIGWRTLDQKLSEQRKEFAKLLGEEWVNKAHDSFMEEIWRMKNGLWGNARIIAKKGR